MSEERKVSILESLGAGETRKKECVIFVDLDKERAGIRMPNDEFFKGVTWQVPLKDLMELIQRTM